MLRPCLYIMDFIPKFNRLIGSSLFWSLLFVVVVKLTPAKTTSAGLWNIRNRIVCLIHGTTVFSLSCYSISIWREYGLPNDEIEEMTIGICMGYFLYNTFLIIFILPLDVYGLLHHAFILIGGIFVYFPGAHGTESMLMIFMMEISNPPMHIKELLKAFNQYNTRLYMIFEILFFMTYLFGRLVLGLPVILEFCLSGRLNLISMLGAALL